MLVERAADAMTFRVIIGGLLRELAGSSTVCEWGVEPPPEDHEETSSRGTHVLFLRQPTEHGAAASATVRQRICPGLWGKHLSGFGGFE